RRRLGAAEARRMTFATMLFALAIATTIASSRAASDDAFLRAYAVTHDERDIHIPACGDVDAFEGEFAFADVEISAHVPFPDVDRRGRYTGRTRFAIRHVTLHFPAAVIWPGITERERAAVKTALAALRHHEIGHVRVAAAEVARLNAGPLTVTPDAEVYRRTEVRRQDAGLAAVARAQRAYDALTEHGRRQTRASGALRGPATELRCDTQ
ncbi:MAG TPA: DUF922 domain-containing protein, partial [Candidatus Elarobacter sp.]